MLRRILSVRRPPTDHRKAGSAAVELGLFAPVFVIVLAGIFDIGSSMYTRIRLEAAIAAGASYALDNISSVTSTNGASLASTIAAVVTTSNAGTAAGGTVVVNNGPTVTVTAGTASSSGKATNANLCYCPTGSPPSWTWGSAVTCGNACTGGGTAGKFVSITGNYSFIPLFPSYGFIAAGTITAGAMVQTQ